MALVIRLARTGGRNEPQYSLVVLDSASRRDGQYLEKLGFYKPKEKLASKKLTMKKDRYDLWIKKGAKPSPTISNLLKSQVREGQ